MILNALVSTAWSWERWETGAPAQWESSTPPSCIRKLCMWSGAQVSQGRTLHNWGCPVGDWLSRTGGNVAFPGKIMADHKTQKLRWKDFFKRIVEKVDGWGFRRSIRRDIVSVRFDRIERHVPCADHDPVITNTFFRQSDKYKAMWIPHPLSPLLEIMAPSWQWNCESTWTKEHPYFVRKSSDNDETDHHMARSVTRPSWRSLQPTQENKILF